MHNGDRKWFFKDTCKHLSVTSLLHPSPVFTSLFYVYPPLVYRHFVYIYMEGWEGSIVRARGRGGFGTVGLRRGRYVWRAVEGKRGLNHLPRCVVPSSFQLGVPPSTTTCYTPPPFRQHFVIPSPSDNNMLLPPPHNSMSPPPTHTHTPTSMLLPPPPLRVKH